MDAHQMEWNEQVAESIINNLRKRRMEGSYAETASQAKQEILKMIPEKCLCSFTRRATSSARRY